MKNVDACSRHLKTLVYSYLGTTYSMRRRDVIVRPYAYSYDVFHRCTNPRQVQVPTTSLFLLHQFILCTILSIILFSILFNHQPSFTCLCNHYVSIPSSLHLKRLLDYYLTPLYLLSVHISMLDLVVLSIILPLKQVPSIIIFPPASLLLTKLII